MEDSAKATVEAFSKTLPPALQGVVRDVPFVQTTYDIGKQHNLNVEKTGVLIEEVIRLISGEHTSKDFVQNLLAALDGDRKKTADVAEAVSRQVLLPIRDALKRATTQPPAAEAKPTAPPAAKALPPSPLAALRPTAPAPPATPPVAVPRAPAPPAPLQKPVMQEMREAPRGPVPLIIQPVPSLRRGPELQPRPPAKPAEPPKLVTPPPAPPAAPALQVAPSPQPVKPTGMPAPKPALPPGPAPAEAGKLPAPPSTFASYEEKRLAFQKELEEFKRARAAAEAAEPALPPVHPEGGGGAPPPAVPPLFPHAPEKPPPAPPSSPRTTDPYREPVE